TTGSADCCACTASGHIAATLSSVMNSRRLIASPEARTGHLCFSNYHVEKSNATVDVRFGSKADFGIAKGHVRFAPESRHKHIYTFMPRGPTNGFAKESGLFFGFALKGQKPLDSHQPQFLAYWFVDQNVRFHWVGRASYRKVDKAHAHGPLGVVHVARHFLTGVMHAAHGRQVKVTHRDLVVFVFFHRLAQRIDLSLVRLFGDGGSEGRTDKNKP